MNKGTAQSAERLNNHIGTWRSRFDLSRVGLALHILRGRPVMYRVDVRGSITVASQQHVTRVVECMFDARDSE